MAAPVCTHWIQSWWLLLVIFSLPRLLRGNKRIAADAMRLSALASQISDNRQRKVADQFRSTSPLSVCWAEVTVAWANLTVSSVPE